MRHVLYALKTMKMETNCECFPVPMVNTVPLKCQIHIHTLLSKCTAMSENCNFDLTNLFQHCVLCWQLCMDKQVLSHSILFQHIIVNVLILGWQKGKRHVQCAKEKWSLDLIRTPIQNRQMKKGPPLVNVHHCWQEITILQDDQLSTILVKKKIYCCHGFTCYEEEGK